MYRQNPIQQPNCLIARTITYPGEVYRVPANGRALRAVSGKAWVTHGGRDIILTGGQRAMLAANGDFALVSPLGRQPLVLEVLAEQAAPNSSLAVTVPAI
jgi:hypothetical protein